MALSKVLISSEVTIKARDIDKAKKFPKNKRFFIIDNFEILKDLILFLANPLKVRKFSMKSQKILIKICYL